MLCEHEEASKTWIIRFVNQPWIRLTGRSAVPPSLQCGGCCLLSVTTLLPVVHCQQSEVQSESGEGCTASALLPMDGTLTVSAYKQLMSELLSYSKSLVQHACFVAYLQLYELVWAGRLPGNVWLCNNVGDVFLGS